MSNLGNYAPQGASASQFDRTNARRTAVDGGILGNWWLHTANVLEWIAESDSQSETGRIMLQPAGWAQVLVDDMPGWHPYASLAGPEPGRRIQITTRHAWDGTNVESASEMSYDSTLNRYIGVGSTSDGSLNQAGKRSRILLAPVDQKPWMITDIVFGWVQLGDEDN